MLDARLERNLEHCEDGENENFRNFMLEILREYFGEHENYADVTALDVACGYMREAPVLTALLAQPVHAVDSDLRRINALRSKTSAVAAVCGDARNLEQIYSGKKFDLIIVRHPDIHSDDWDTMYQQCRAVLNERGILVTTFHSSDEEFKAREILGDIGFEICRSGQNKHGNWYYGIVGFAGIDGFVIVAKKSASAHAIGAAENGKAAAGNGGIIPEEVDPSDVSTAMRYLIGNVDPVNLSLIYNSIKSGA
jgi:SAM-dependent methyltransferase